MILRFTLFVCCAESHNVVNYSQKPGFSENRRKTPVFHKVSKPIYYSQNLEFCCIISYCVNCRKQMETFTQDKKNTIETIFLQMGMCQLLSIQNRPYTELLGLTKVPRASMG
jgi:hypothetical protein